MKKIKIAENKPKEMQISLEKQTLMKIHKLTMPIRYHDDTEHFLQT